MTKSNTTWPPGYIVSLPSRLYRTRAHIYKPVTSTLYEAICGTSGTVKGPLPGADDASPVCKRCKARLVKIVTDSKLADALNESSSTRQNDAAAPEDR